MHGVVKEASTTTRLRVVFDASAKSSSGVALNDQLLPGPSRYPKLTTLLTQFRAAPIGLTADISKMFREVGLHPDERDYHRFLHQLPSGEFQVWRMKRLTFGVTSSPFLATEVLRQAASDHHADYPLGSDAILRCFYVDDCLLGAASSAAAVEVRVQLTELLSRARMTLRKWRSSSQEVLATIPEDLREASALVIPTRPEECSKTLGVHWDTASDTLHVSVPELTVTEQVTKRQVASAIARTFDVLGWYAPATILMKVLLQRVWRARTEWDEEIPSTLFHTWQRWRDQLGSIPNHSIPRCIKRGDDTAVSHQLHGFSDASNDAYGAVVYMRTFHKDTNVDIFLVTARSRVAPVKGESTIPRLELAGALLLANLLELVAQDLHIKKEEVYAWCDSTIVLGWINSQERYRVYVSRRIKMIVEKFPPHHWRYVATDHNPADVVSRGLPPEELMASQLWWKGPPWLSTDPRLWPRRPDLNRQHELPELKSLAISLAPENKTSLEDYLQRFSSWSKALKVTAWLKRFCSNSRPHRAKISSPRLEAEEIQAARVQIIGQTQRNYYPQVFKAVKEGKSVSKGDALLPLFPLVDNVGLLRVGGRLHQSEWTYSQKHPIILPRGATMTKLLVWQTHRNAGHAGPATLLAILADSYHISGVKKLTRAVSRTCVPCQRTYARTQTQLMGSLPNSRICPSPPFAVVGLDFAGPFLLRRGNPRKPTIYKAYCCLFVCFSTRAVHLELVSDLTSEAFLACFCRFAADEVVPA